MEKVVKVQQVTPEPTPAEPAVAPVVPANATTNNKPSLLKLKKYNMKKYIPFAIAILMVVAGIGTGYTLAGNEGSGSKSPSGLSMNDGDSLDEAGVEGEAYKDEAEGELKRGDFEGDGTHYLDRGMGPEKDVYLTSTVIDLESFAGKKVKVWGESIAAQNAPWLMDVGKIKVIK